MGELRDNTFRRAEIAKGSDQFLSKIEPLVETGFAIVLLREQSKSPIDRDWTTAPVAKFDQLKRWYQPGQNVGVRLGEPSKVAGLYLHVFDVDIKDAAYKKNAIRALNQLLPDVDWRKLPRVKSGSGGPSFHVYFLCAKPFKSKKLAKNKDEKWEIELFGTGKQVVVPPSVHPDTGNAYKWVIEPDFDPETDEIDIESIEYLVDEEGAPAQREASTEKTDLTDDEIQDIFDEMQDWNDDRDTWRNVGFALQHHYGHKDGWPIFDAWSRKNNKKYNPTTNRVQWRTFKSNHKNPKTMRTLIREFRIRMMLLAYKELDEEDEQPEKELSGDIPEHLLSVPGALQDVVDYYNENCLVEQPEFAVLAALAFGSLIAGRNNVTDFNNYASVYFMGVGESGAGKEFVRSTLAHMLKACGFSDMNGPQNMTSEGALLTWMTKSPKLLIPTDEFGKRLGADRSGSDTHRQNVYNAYLSIFGQLDSEWVPNGYSGQGKSKEEVQAILGRKIVRPSPTLVFTTTPSTLFEAIGTGDVKSGFMSRFIVVQGRPGLQEQRIFKAKRHIPERLIEWAKFIATRAGSDDEDVLLRVDQSALVDPFLVPFSSKAIEHLKVIEKERIKKMRQYHGDGLHEVLNRAREITHRIAMIVALSDDYDRIQVKHLKWAWAYVSHHAERTIGVLQSNLGRSEMHQIADPIVEKIKAAGEKGMTAHEIARNFRSFGSLLSKDRGEVLSILKNNHGIIEHKVGRQRLAFVAPKHVKLRSKE